MSFKIITDSCGEIPVEFSQSVNVGIVPLTITVEDHTIIDDETFDQADFLARVARSKNGPKSSCPSPAAYLDEMDVDVDNIYVITLSANLSGSYLSAEMAKNMLLEKHPDKNVHVFDSCSASCGQTQIAYWIKEFEEQGMPFDKIVEKCEAKKDKRCTYFILDNLETLRKNGRLSNVKAFVATHLNIKPIMAGSKIGTIFLAGKAIGFNKAIAKMVELSIDGADTENSTLMISHCNCLNRAKEVKKAYEKRAKFKDIILLDTRGISSMYANDGGIIVTF